LTALRNLVWPYALAQLAASPCLSAVAIGGGRLAGRSIELG
jgi:hypothetical protein